MAQAQAQQPKGTMTLNQIVAIAADTTFQGQCRAAAVAYALTALNAGSTNHSQADQLKWALATATIADGCTALQPRFIWAIANSGAGTFTLNDAGDTNDPLIQSAMVSLWPQIAGVTPAMVGN